MLLLDSNGIVSRHIVVVVSIRLRHPNVIALGHIHRLAAVIVARASVAMHLGQRHNRRVPSHQIHIYIYRRSSSNSIPIPLLHALHVPPPFTTTTKILLLEVIPSGNIPTPRVGQVFRVVGVIGSVMLIVLFLAIDPEGLLVDDALVEGLEGRQTAADNVEKDLGAGPAVQGHQLPADVLSERERVGQGGLDDAKDAGSGCGRRTRKGTGQTMGWKVGTYIYMLKCT